MDDLVTSGSEGGFQSHAWGSGIADSDSDGPDDIWFQPLRTAARRSDLASVVRGSQPCSGDMAFFEGASRPSEYHCSAARPTHSNGYGTPPFSDVSPSEASFAEAARNVGLAPGNHSHEPVAHSSFGADQHQGGARLRSPSSPQDGSSLGALGEAISLSAQQVAGQPDNGSPFEPRKPELEQFFADFHSWSDNRQQGQRQAATQSAPSQGQQPATYSNVQSGTSGQESAAASTGMPAGSYDPVTARIQEAVGSRGRDALFQRRANQRGSVLQAPAPVTVPSPHTAFRDRSASITGLNPAQQQARCEYDSSPAGAYPRQQPQHAQCFVSQPSSLASPTQRAELGNLGQNHSVGHCMYADFVSPSQQFAGQEVSERAAKAVQAALLYGMESGSPRRASFGSTGLPTPVTPVHPTYSMAPSQQVRQQAGVGAPTASQVQDGANAGHGAHGVAPQSSGTHELCGYTSTYPPPRPGSGAPRTPKARRQNPGHRQAMSPIGSHSQLIPVTMAQPTSMAAPRSPPKTRSVPDLRNAVMSGLGEGNRKIASNRRVASSSVNAHAISPSPIVPPLPSFAVHSVKHSQQGSTRKEPDARRGGAGTRTIARSAQGSRSASPAVSSPRGTSSPASAGGYGQISFVNYSIDDADELCSGVAPSGSYKIPLKGFGSGAEDDAAEDMSDSDSDQALESALSGRSGKRKRTSKGRSETGSSYNGAKKAHNTWRTASPAPSDASSPQRRLARSRTATSGSSR